MSNGALFGEFLSLMPVSATLLADLTDDQLNLLSQPEGTPPAAAESLPHTPPPPPRDEDEMEDRVPGITGEVNW